MSSTNCPTCNRPISTTGSDRPTNSPFCSDRCRSIDLGKWFNEAYRVPVETERVLREAADAIEGAQPGDESPE